MAAARQNPEIMEQLSARGIQINRTEPQMPPQQMNQANHRKKHDKVLTKVVMLFQRWCSWT